MSTGPLTAPRSTPPTHPRGMGIAERSYETGWRAGAYAVLLAAVQTGSVDKEVLKLLYEVAETGPQREQG